MRIFTESFAIRAYVAVATVGLTAPAVGAFLVQRRIALVGDGVTYFVRFGSTV